MPTVSGVPIISGGLFQFLIDGYAPPTWDGDEYVWPAPVSAATCYDVWTESNTQWVDYDEHQWGLCFPGLLNQIWSDNTYVFAAIDFGLDVIDMVTEQKVAYAEFEYGFSTVWADDDNVYLGSYTDGVKYIPRTCISGTTASGTPSDLTSCLADYVTYYNMSSQRVLYLHGAGNYMSFCTPNEVFAEYRTEFGGSYCGTTVSGARKCFTLPDGTFYYTSVSGNSADAWAVSRVNNFTFPPAVEYRTGGWMLPLDVRITDIFVTTAGTDNTLFIATSSGVCVIDEGTSAYGMYYNIGG
ncbi:hypothetical protein DRQ25_09550 [Candidatus Fermentibacteria bacterium]|nr:MAG: hypothetical protein DRQ25_09550 [Candidatus Fermentibacteria bacterium]